MTICLASKFEKQESKVTRGSKVHPAAENKTIFKHIEGTKDITDLTNFR